MLMFAWSLSNASNVDIHGHVPPAVLSVAVAKLHFIGNILSLCLDYPQIESTSLVLCIQLIQVMIVYAVCSYCIVLIKLNSK